MKNLLGIYIPTYNRMEKLAECLGSLIPEASRFNLPVYISDNASTDGTEKFIKNLKKEYANIHYKKNKNNLGYPLNIVNLLKMADTEFVWFFGDDDKFKENAIGEVLKYIKKGYDFLQVNSDLYDNDMIYRINDRTIHIEHDLVYNPGEHNIALDKAGYYAGFLSAMITRRSFLIRELKKLNKKSVPKLEYIQSILFYRSIVDKKGICIAKPLFSIRATKKFPERGIEHQFKNYPETLHYLEGYYEEKSLSKFRKPKAILTTIFMSKRDQPNMAKVNVRYIIKNKDISNLDKLLGYMILKVPDPLISKISDSLKKIYHATKLKG